MPPAKSVVNWWPGEVVQLVAPPAKMSGPEKWSNWWSTLKLVVHLIVPCTHIRRPFSAPRCPRTNDSLNVNASIPCTHAETLDKNMMLLQRTPLLLIAESASLHCQMSVFMHVL